MRIRLVNTIAGFLIGAGVAAAQGPSNGVSSGPAPRNLSGAVMGPGTYSSVSPLSVPAPIEATVDTGADANSSWSHSWETHYKPYTVYASGEFMLMNLRDFHIPSLASTIPVGLIQVTAGDVINGVQTNAATFSLPVSVANNPVLGNNPLDFGDQSGARFTAGVWLDEDQDFGIEGSYFWIGRGTQNFQATTANTVNQFNIDTGIRQQFFVTGAGGGAPQLTRTAVLVVPRQTTANLVGAGFSELSAGELNVRSVLGRFGAVTFTGLTGVRHIRFIEGLSASNSVTLRQIRGLEEDPALGFPPTITFSTFDSVRTKNEIYAAQVGMDMDAECGGFFFNVRGRVGLGGNRETVDISGRTSSAGGANPITNAPGGLLSGPGDQGTHRRYRIAIIPEVNAKIGYSLNDAVRLYVGYDMMYMHHVARPDAQATTTSINTQVTVNQSTNTVNVSQPTFRFRDQDIWAAGINCGFELRY